MPSVYNNRTFEALILQNTSDGRPGDGLDISTYIKEGGLGEIGWVVDEEPTSLKAGTVSITLDDDEVGTVWSFLSNNLTTTAGLLPPWFILSLDGVQKFIGLIKEAPVRAETGDDLTISFSATSWVSMLEKKRISVSDPNWTRQLPRDTVATSQGALVACSSVKNKELRRGHDRNAIFLPASEKDNYTVGDWVYFQSYGGYTHNRAYQITGKQMRENDGLNVCLYLGSGFWWSENPSDPQNYRQGSNIYRVFRSTSTAPAYLVDEDFNSQDNTKTAKTTIKLKIVDGLMAGDVLEKVTNYLNPDDSAFTVTVVDVDPITHEIYIDTALNGKIVKGVTTLLLSQASLSDAVYVPVTSLLEKAIDGLGVIDYSSWKIPTLPNPAFSFISPNSPGDQNTRIETVSGPQEIQPGLSEVLVLGTNGKAWSGLPGLGWVASEWTTGVNWTEQQETPPSHLLPFYAMPSSGDISVAVAQDRIKNRTQYPDIADYTDDSNSAHAPASGNTSYRMVYDYSNMRYYEFQFSGSNPSAISVKTFNGSTWTGVTGFANTTPLFVSAVPFKDCGSSVGGGYGLLGLYQDNTVRTILSNVSLSAQLPPEAKAGAFLKVTPNGVYFITGNGYGKIYISGGELKYNYCQIFNPNKIQTVTLIASTFVYAYGRIISLGKASYRGKITDERWSEDTYLFQLKAEPAPKASDSVISYDFIVKNIPRVTQAVRCPTTGAVMGLMGSRLFTISNQLPETIERINTGNKTAQTLIEYACTVTNSVAVPKVSGGLKLVTRGHAGTPMNVNVDQVSITESRWSNKLCNLVIMKGFDKDTPGVAASTTQAAGITISYTNEVFIRNSSQAKAIAQSYLAFYEKPRVEQEQEWVLYDPGTPFWETLEPFQVLTINGNPKQWYLMGMNYNFETYKCKVTLLAV